MVDTLGQLNSRMQELKDLSGVIGLATWDQETYLPPKGQGARADQLATLQGLYHQRLTEPALGELMGAALESPGLTSDHRAMVRVLDAERRRALNVPTRLVRELAEAQSLGGATWREARKQRRFEPFRASVETLVALRREQADCIGHQGERYDALLDAYEPGMRVRRLTPVLAALEKKLIPLVNTLAEAAASRADALAGRRFDLQAQWRFTFTLLEAMGFDLEAGRQDQSIHPFSGGTHPTDVRLTTHLHEDSPFPALFSTIHEGGHGLYEQGFSPQHYRTPLAAAPSMGLHESQSRLWENKVGRSEPFWRHHYPLFQAAMGEALAGVSLQDFLRSANRVKRTLVRIESDELTYNLHISLRYGLERALIAGDMEARDLPGEWNERSQALLGITPADDLTGVLQDIHWSTGDFGYFPTYSLGNLYAASLWAAARRALPGLEEGIAQGRLLPLRDWLREQIHSQGYRYGAEELIEKVTGRGLTDEDFIAYLRAKYGALYDVSF